MLTYFIKNPIWHEEFNLDEISIILFYIFVFPLTRIDRLDLLEYNARLHARPGLKICNQNFCFCCINYIPNIKPNLFE